VTNRLSSAGKSTFPAREKALASFPSPSEWYICGARTHGWVEEEGREEGEASKLGQVKGGKVEKRGFLKWMRE